MHRLRTPWLIAAACVPLIVATAHAELHPPPTLQRIANAEIVVQGRYRPAKEGVPEFVIQRNFTGRPLESAWPGNDVRVQEAGPKITCNVASPSTWGTGHNEYRIDATRSRLWFQGVKGLTKYVPPGQIVSLPMVQPIELADGFAAVREKRVPPLLFCVLQSWDESMRRDAMEEIVAGKDPKTLARLQEIGADLHSDAAAAAVQALLKMNLFDADRHWDHWTRHPAATFMGNQLARRDRQRATDQVLAALRKPDETPKLRTLLQFSHLIPDEQLLDVYEPLLKHQSEALRGDVTRQIGWQLTSRFRQRGESAEAEQRFAQFERTALPLLKKRASDDGDKVVRRYAQQALDTYQHAPSPQPVPEYRAEDNFKRMLDQSTSRSTEGENIRRAGQELARYEFEAAFAELKRRLVSENFNHDLVMNGFSFLRDPGKMEPDPRCLTFIREHLRTHEAGASTFPAAVRAAARLDQKETLAVIHAAMEQNKQHLDYTRAECYLDALAELDDPAAIAEIRKLKPHAQYRATIKYVRSLARHGDAWAIDQLLEAANGRAGETMLKDTRWWSPADVADALRRVDGPASTAVLKRAVEQLWPTREAHRTNVPICSARCGIAPFASNCTTKPATGSAGRSSGKWRAATRNGSPARRSSVWLRTTCPSGWPVSSSFAH